MKKNQKKGFRTTQQSSLDYLSICAFMLDKAIQKIAPLMFTKDQVIAMNEHLTGIMRVIIDKAEELNC